MDEEPKNQETVQEETPQTDAVPAEEKAEERTEVNFSSIPVRSTKQKSNTKTFLGIFVLVIFVVGGFLIFKDGSKSQPSEATPTPLVEIATPTPAPATTEAPVNKAKIVVEIQNGTGISGEAAYLRDQLKKLSYSNFKVGNAASQENITTVVTFNKNLTQSVQDELTTKLKELYKEVSVKSSATQVSDVVVITGLQKGATAKPSASPVASPSATPAATPTATPTATP